MSDGKLIRPKAIIFDWDNTLADTWPIIHNALNKTFEAMGRGLWTMEDVKSGREGIHQSLRDSFPRLFGDKWKEAREHYYKHFLDSHLEKIAMLPGADETLEILTGSGIYLAIVSNKTGDYLRKEVEHLGWDKHFSKVVGATDAKADKPHPAPVYMALDGSSIDISADNVNHVWFVGDSETDIECAINSKSRAVFFGERKLSDNYLTDTRINYEIKHCKTHNELQELLRKLL